MGVEPPCCLQNDFSLVNRRVEENGFTEAASPANENLGFMAYNVLAGGVLTGKYGEVPAAVDDRDRARSQASAQAPRGRMDTRSWGNTLYRYRTTAALEAAAEYAALARKAGMSPTELALRWTRQRRGVTTTLLGTSNVAQLEEDLKYYKAAKPLGEELMWEIDRVHMKNRLPIFSSDRAGRDWLGEGEIGEPIP